MRASTPWVVVDVPHLWSGWARRILVSADEVVVVASPDLANLRNAKNLIDNVKGARLNDAAPRLILNGVGMLKRPEIGAAEFAKAVETGPTAIIPHDAKLFGASANNGQMIAETPSTISVTTPALSSSSPATRTIPAMRTGRAYAPGLRRGWAWRRGWGGGRGRRGREDHGDRGGRREHGRGCRRGAASTAGTLGAGAAALKLIGAVLVVSATVAAGAVAVHHARRAPVVRVAIAEKNSPSSARRTTTGAAAVGPATAPETAPPEVPVPASDPPRQSAKMHSSAAPVTVASAAQKSAQAHAVVSPPRQGLAEAANASAPFTARRSAPDVADEASLFHDGVVALRSGQPARALELFELHARLYPHGVLAEERDAESALALADLGRTTEARAAIDQFLQRHPASPLAARLLARAHLLDAHGGKPGVQSP